jgi:3-dehydroquinate synthase
MLFLINTYMEESIIIYDNEDFSESRKLLGEIENLYTSVYILCDTNTHQFCVPIIEALVPESVFGGNLIVDAHESSKSFKIVDDLCIDLLQRNADRNTLLINLGGGMVSDLGGLLASVFKRGIDFINIPTSLLAMIDAAIGGKNGVNIGNLKNQAGTFKNPSYVIINPNFLKTIPQEHYKSGLGEAFKYILLDSDAKSTFSDFELSDYEQKTDFIKRCIDIKLQIVKADPYEKDLRKILNAGHSIGHAIESSEIFEITHGEAVASGLLIEAWISFHMGMMNKSILDKIDEFYRKHFNYLTIGSADLLIKPIYADKKNRGNDLLFVLFDSDLNPVIDVPVAESIIRKAISSFNKARENGKHQFS